MTTYTAPTPRRSMTKARAARIFIANDGVCYLCKTRVRDGETWEVEHPDELADGGSDDDAALKVAHTRCHKAKSAASRTTRAKRNRLLTQGWTGKPRKSRPLDGSRNSPWRKPFNGPPERRT